MTDNQSSHHRPADRWKKDYSKIFGIGRNKTGTTSLEAFFRIYGFHVPDQQEQEKTTTRCPQRGEYDSFYKFISQYDCFQDQPFSNGSVYITADKLFPKSKFILTERDPEDWFDSVSRFTCMRFGVEDIQSITPDVLATSCYIYPGYEYESAKSFLTRQLPDGSWETSWELLFDRDHYIVDYLERNSLIKKYFYGRELDFMAIDLSREKTTHRLCEFLNIPASLAINTPHLNRTM